MKLTPLQSVACIISTANKSEYFNCVVVSVNALITSEYFSVPYSQYKTKWKPYTTVKLKPLPANNRQHSEQFLLPMVFKSLHLFF